MQPRIYLAAEPGVDAGALQAIAASLAATFGAQVRRLPPRPAPDDAYDPQRRQYRSSDLLRRLDSSLPDDALAILGVTEHDLFIPVLRFVFGQARLGGGSAVISLARLRPEFLHLEPDPALLAERAVKEAQHEIGHAIGRVHCPDPGCVMSLSIQIAQVDRKAAAFCRDCRALVDETLGEAAVGRRTRPALEERS